MKAPGTGTRVVAAMSGGVDSAVAAALMKEQGFEVVGVTLQLYDRGAETARSKTCCAGADIADARRAADSIGIPHYVLDYEAVFRAAVIDDFADTYLAGATPIPCVRCNQRVKFRDLLGAARDLGAVALATGHYARRVAGAGGPELHRASDLRRDQSYFLFATTRAQLDFLRFPLGHMPKEATRAHARRFGLALADKPDSQDICFVPDGDYARAIDRLRPGAARPGEIVHIDGTVLGAHKGIAHYTIGQRRGLALDRLAGEGREPLHVVRLEPASDRVIVGPRAALGAVRVLVGEVNFLGDGAIPANGLRVAVKLRSAMEPVPATLYPDPSGDPERAAVVLDAAFEGPAPGQACVFYAGERVLGGGFILREQARAEMPAPRLDTHAATA